MVPGHDTDLVLDPQYRYSNDFPAVAAPSPLARNASPSVDENPPPEVFDMPQMLGLPECRGPLLSTSQQFSGTALVVFAVLLWPVSAIPLALVLGLRRARVLFGNLGFLPQTAWVAEARAAGEVGQNWQSARWGTFVLHHGTTLSFLAALGIYLYSLSPRPSPVDAGSSAILWHVIWLQLLTTALGLASTRLSFALYVATFSFRMQPLQTTLLRDITRVELAPSLLGISSAKWPRLVTSQMGPIVSGRANGFPPDCVVFTLSLRGYELLREIHANAGVVLLPSAETLQAQPQGCVCLPSGEAILSVAEVRRVPLPNTVHVGGKVAATRSIPGSGAAAADDPPSLGLCTGTRVRLGQLLSFMPIFSIYIPLLRARIFTLVLVTLSLTLLSATVPFMVRSALEIPVLGISWSDAAILLILTLTDCLRLCGGSILTRVQTFFLYGVPRVSMESIFLVVRPPACLFPPVSDTFLAIGDGGPLDGPNVRVRMPAGLPLSVSLAAAKAAPPVVNPRTHASIVDDLRGTWVLDSPESVSALFDAVLGVIKSISTKEFGVTATINALTPCVVIFSSLALSVVFTAAPDAVGKSQNYGGAFKRAAIIPTVVTLLSFISNCVILVAAFLEAARTVNALRHIDAEVQRTASQVSAYLGQLAQVRTAEVGSCDASSGGLDDRGRSMSALEKHAAWEHATALRASLRDLHIFLDAEVRNACGIRFLGCIRPGTGATGGLITVMISATGLALRLTSTIYGIY